MGSRLGVGDTIWITVTPAAVPVFALPGAAAASGPVRDSEADPDAELLVGVEMAATTRRRVGREAFVNGVLEAVPVITCDEEIARVHAELLVAVRRVGRPRRAHDLIIAATARARAQTVLTGDGSALADLPGVTILTTR